jgi:hypothetical protein
MAGLDPVIFFLATVRELTRAEFDRSLRKLDRQQRMAGSSPAMTTSSMNGE